MPVDCGNLKWILSEKYDNWNKTERERSENADGGGIPEILTESVVMPGIYNSPLLVFRKCLQKQVKKGSSA